MIQGRINIVILIYKFTNCLKFKQHMAMSCNDLDDKKRQKNPMRDPQNNTNVNKAVCK